MTIKSPDSDGDAIMREMCDRLITEPPDGEDDWLEKAINELFEYHQQPAITAHLAKIFLVPEEGDPAETSTRKTLRRFGLID